MKRFILFCALLMVYEFSCGSAVTAVSVSNRALETLYERLENGSALEHSYDLLMGRILPRIASEIGDSRKVQVNLEYSEDAINVYVVKPEQLRNISGTVPPGFRSWAEAVENMKGTLLAVPPNIIYVDDIYLGIILICTHGHSDIYTRVYNSERSTTPKGFAPRVGNKWQVAGTYARFQMMLMLMDERNSLRRGLRLWHSKILNQLPLRTQEEWFLTSMLLVFGHEFAHLREGTEEGFDDTLQLLLDRSAGKQRHEEKKADEISISAVRRYYDRLVTSYAAAKGSGTVE